MSALSFLRLLSDFSLLQGVPQTSSLPSTSDSRKSPNDSESEVKNALLSQLQKLMTTNLVVRLNNFSMWKVSTSNAKSAPKEFISGKKHAVFFAIWILWPLSCLKRLTQLIDPIVDWPFECNFLLPIKRVTNRLCLSSQEEREQVCQYFKTSTALGYSFRRTSNTG